jgi:hypothetical protein
MTAKLKAVYSVAELAALAGVSRKVMRRLLAPLELVDVAPHPGPRRKRLVRLADFKAAAPELWRSIRLAREGERTIAAGL